MNFIRVKFFIIVAITVVSWGGAHGDYSNSTSGDQEVEKVNELSFELTSIVWGGASVAYEYRLLPYLALSIPLTMRYLPASLLPGVAKTGLRAYNYWGVIPDFSLQSGMGAKFYLDNWYIHPSFLIGYSFSRLPPEIVISGRAATLEPRLMIGHKTVTPCGVTIDIAAGGYARFFTPSTVAATVYAPDLKLSVGYTW